MKGEITMIKFEVREKDIVIKHQFSANGGKTILNSYINFLSSKEAGIKENKKRTFYRQREEVKKDFSHGTIDFMTTEELYQFMRGYQIAKGFSIWLEQTGFNVSEIIQLSIQQWEKEEKRREEILKEEQIIDKCCNCNGKEEGNYIPICWDEEKQEMITDFYCYRCLWEQEEKEALSGQVTPDM